MRLLQTLLALAVALVFIGDASAAKGNKSKKKQNQVRGVVETVSPESVVVKVRHGRGKGGATTDETFQLGANTQYELVTIKKHAKGEKPEVETKPGTLSDLKPGGIVRLVVNASAAEKVGIVQGLVKDQK
jgi:hypothetical protein